MTLRYFFLSILILMLSIGCNSSSSKTTNFTVTIEAEGIYDGVRAYIKRNENGKTTTATDTAIAQNGKFQFKGEVLAPEMRFITIDGLTIIVGVLVYGGLLGALLALGAFSSPQ